MDLQPAHLEQPPRKQHDKPLGLSISCKSENRWARLTGNYAHIPTGSKYASIMLDHEGNRWLFLSRLPLGEKTSAKIADYQKELRIQSQALALEIMSKIDYPNRQSYSVLKYTLCDPTPYNFEGVAGTAFRIQAAPPEHEKVS